MTTNESTLVEKLARETWPILFGGLPDDKAGPATRATRQEHRELIAKIIGALADNVDEGMVEAGFRAYFYDDSHSDSIEAIKAALTAALRHHLGDQG